MVTKNDNQMAWIRNIEKLQKEFEEALENKLLV